MSYLARRVAPKLRGKTIIAELPEKLAKRATQVRRQNVREQKRNKDRNDTAAKWERIRRQVQHNRAITENVNNARKWRKEDYVLGALAPRRDVGALRDTFGAMSLDQFHGPPKKDPREWGIAIDDRVVVVQKGHRDYGKIGKVKSVMAERERVTVEGINLHDIQIPSYMLVRDEDKTAVRPYEVPLSLSSVRLVVPLQDPDSGLVRDTVVNEIKLQRLTTRERKGIDPPTRTIAGVKPTVMLPYRHGATVKEETTSKDHAIDTLRIEVEQRSWTPTLHMPPMPPAVLDELRNKYSRFRIRHEPEYLAAKAREQETKLAEHRRRRAMMTPLKERRRIERLQRKEVGVPELSDEMLAEIGRTMERNLGGAVVLDAVGVMPEGVEKVRETEA